MVWLSLKTLMLFFFTMENIQFEESSYLFHLYLIMDACAIKQREKPECFPRPVGFTVKKLILCILK